MNIDTRLRKLEVRYRSALSAAVVAKARYLALDGEKIATAARLERARDEWHNLESRKAGLVAQMGALEELEQQLAI